MTPSERLKHIAELFGGANDLARAIKMSPSGMSRRINGEIPVKPHDWFCVEAAVTKRVGELQKVLVEGLS